MTSRAISKFESYGADKGRQRRALARRARRSSVVVGTLRFAHPTVVNGNFITSRASPLDPRGKEDKDQELSVLAKRKPRRRSLMRTSVVNQMRRVERRSLGSSSHEPPRTTRLLPSPPCSQAEASAG